MYMCRKKYYCHRPTLHIVQMSTHYHGYHVYTGINDVTVIATGINEGGYHTEVVIL